MTIPRIERLSRQLSQPGLSTAERRAVLLRAAGDIVQPYKGLDDIANAITLVKNEVVRAELGLHLWAQLNTPRVLVGKELPKTAGLVTAAIVTVDDASMLLGAKDDILGLLTGALDGPMNGIKDPLQPDISPLLLVVPLALLSFDRGCAINFMLGNPTRNETDESYGQLWFDAQRATKGTLNTLAYLFLSTREGTTFAAATSPDVRPDTGPRTHQILDIITSHAHSLNQRLPGVNMQMAEVCSFAAAVMRGAEIRIRKAMRDEKHLIGAYDTARRELPEDVAYGDVLQEVMDEFDRTQQGRSQAAEETYGKAVLGLLCSEEIGRQQLGQCLMMSTHGVPNIAMNVALPQGVTTAMLAQWWRETIDPEGRAELIQLPTAILSKVPTGMASDSLYRDDNGEWVELGLLRLGSDGRELFRTASWASALKTKQVALESFEQLVDVPHGRLVLNALDLEKGVHAHFTAPVAQTLLRLAAQRGRSYSWMREEMVERHPGLAGAQMYLPHATDAFMPDGFWAALHFEKSAGVVFRMRASLQEAMDQTDLKGAFPLQLLRCPYPDVYLQFAQPMQLSEESVLGAYCSDVTHSDEECAEMGCPQGSRTFSWMLVVTHKGGLSPTLFTRDFHISPDDDRDLAAMVRASVKQAVSMRAEADEPVPEAEREGERFQNVLMMVMKLLLYISMKSARTELHLNRSALLERMNEARGNERDKLARKAAATYDHIVIGPETPEWFTQDRAKAEYGKAVWPVRGYYQPIRFGAGRQQVRSDWFPPSFRHRHGMSDSGEAPNPKDYDVK